VIIDFDNSTGIVYSLIFFDKYGNIIASVGDAANAFVKEIVIEENERIVGVKTRCGNN